MASKNPFGQIDLLELQKRIDDPHFVAAVKKDPKKGMEPVLAGTPLETDVWIYRIVVIALGLTVIIAVGGAVYLAATVDPAKEAVPEILVAIGSAAVGALAGLLAPTPGRNSNS